MLKQLARWLSERTLITQLRLDAALYEPAPPREPGAIGRAPKKGKRKDKLTEVLGDEDTVWQANASARAEQPRLDFAPGCADARIGFGIGDPPVELRPLLLGERESVRLHGDAVPDVFDELDALGDTELQDLGKWVRSHGFIVSESGRTGKEGCRSALT
jgi:hypothetical protein